MACYIIFVGLKDVVSQQIVWHFYNIKAEVFVCLSGFAKTVASYTQTSLDGQE